MLDYKYLPIEAHNIELKLKPDFLECMNRIYAWLQGEIVDRPPVRFSAHNEEYDVVSQNQSNWKSLKERWMDTRFQVDHYIESIQNKKFLGETFPIFWPNLGPNVYSAFYGADMTFGEVTSWIEHYVDDYDKLDTMRFSKGNIYFQKLVEMTQYALEKCEGECLVGYTDLHPGIDCVDALRGTENVCLDMYMNKDNLDRLIKLSMQDFENIYNYFDQMLKEKKQLSVSWMGIPCFGKMHIPSCDFSAMISNDTFKEYELPILLEEVKMMDVNIFHLDGKDVARHIDDILAVDEIQAIQWVQGVGLDQPIMQWLPFIKKIQAAGKSVIVDLTVNELEEFISKMDPKRLYLCISTNDYDEQEKILDRIKKW
jgi:hypothetical protein